MSSGKGVGIMKTNMGTGQGNGASPMVFATLKLLLVDTGADNPRATSHMGEVHVSSKVPNQVYIRPGQMSHEDIVLEEDDYDPKTHKKVTWVITNPSNGSFRWVTEVRPIGEQINKIIGAKKKYWQKRVMDIDGNLLYFCSQAALKMHVHLYRTEEERVCYVPQDHLSVPSAMPVHHAVSGVSPANLPNRETPPSDMDCGSDGSGGVME
jgi:hypothetical protein